MKQFLSLFLVLVFCVSFVGAEENEAKKLCDVEIKKEQPQRSVLEKQCSLVAEEYLAEKDYNQATWYYLLATKKDKVLALESKVTDSYGYGNVAHSYILKGKNILAKSLYLRFLKNASIPWADEAMLDDYKLLLKLYPKQKDSLKKGLALWNEIYKPLKEINTLYYKYKKQRKEKIYIEAIATLKKVIILQRKSKLQNKIMIANNEYSLGVVYNYNNKYKKSLDVLHQVEKIYEGEKSEEKTLGYLLGWIADGYENLQENTKALDYYQKSLTLKEKILGKEHDSTVISYDTIGALHESMGNYKKALIIYKKLLVIYKVEKDSYKIISLYSKISKLYKKIGDKKEGKIWKDKEEELDVFIELKELDEDCVSGDKDACYNLAYEYYYEYDDLNSSKKYYEDLCSSEYVYREESDVCFEYGQVLEDLNEYKSAVNAYNRGCEENNNHSCQALGQLYYSNHIFKNLSKAKKYLNQIPIEELSGKSLNIMSKIYFEGLSEDINISKATKYATLGCNKRGIEKCYACCYLLRDIQKVVTYNNSNIELKDEKGQTPLIAAGYKNNVQIIKLLLDKGANINAKNNEGETALMNASYKGHELVVKLLLEQGANPNIITKSGYSALKYAIQQEKNHIAELLLSNGIDTNFKDKKGRNYLYSASYKNNIETIKLLLDKGIDINSKDNEGSTALMNASYKGHDKVVKFLLYKGANPNIITKSGYSALKYAIQQEKNHIVKLLLSTGVDINFKDKKGRNHLYTASYKNNIETIKLLLDKGIDINSKDNEGSTALMNASYKGHDKVVKFLLYKGANPNIITEDNYSALKYAIEKKHIKVAVQLLNKGEYAGKDFFKYAVVLEQDSNFENSKKSLLWYKKSAKDGYKKAEEYLANKYWKEAYGYDFYRKRKDFGKQPKEALYWNTVLAKKGETEAQYRLGYIYCCGLDFKKDLNKSKYWFDKALSNKEFKVGYSLEEYVFEGVKNEVINADKWIYKHEETIAYKYKKSNQYKKALASYKKLKSNSFFKKVKKYETKSVNRNVEELEVLSFENNNTYIQKKYAKEYFDNKEYSLALRFYEALYKKGILDAGYQIGIIYLKGSKDLKKDYTLAKKWFEKLAKQDYIKAYKSMALLYEKGYGVNKDNNKSITWRQKAYNLERELKAYEEKILSVIHNRELSEMNNYLKEKKLKNMHFAICAATRDGSLDIVKSIIEEYPKIDLNTMCQNYDTGYSLLYIASDLGYEDLVSYFISRKVDSSDYSKSSSSSPLEISLFHGYQNISKKLLNENKKSQNTTEYEILKAAANNDINFETVKKYSKLCGSYREAIYNSFNSSSYKNFKYLMEKTKFKFVHNDEAWGMPINTLKYAKIIFKNNPIINNTYRMLRRAVYTENYNLLKLYINNDINIDAYRKHKFIEGKEYLMSSYNMSYDMMKIILKHTKIPKEQANSTFKSNTTSELSLKKIKLLLRHGLDVNIENKCGRTPLMFSENKDITKLLLDYGANINKESKFSKIECGYSVTPLFAMVNNHWISRTNEHIDLLLDYGADINHSSSYTEETLLHFLLHSSDEFNLNIFNHLLNRGIDLNKINGEYNSPLSVALKKNFRSATISLLNHNAIITLGDIKMAIEYNQIDIFELMLRKKLTIKYIDILALTTEIGSATMSKIVLEKGVQIDDNSILGRKIIFNIFENKLEALFDSLTIKRWHNMTIGEEK